MGFLDRIVSGFIDLLFVIIRVIDDPAGNRVQMALIVVGAALIVLVLVLSVMLFMPKKKRTLRRIEIDDIDPSGSADEEDPDTGAEPEKPAHQPVDDGTEKDSSHSEIGPSRRHILLLAGSALLLLAGVIGWNISGSDAYCADLCHGDIGFVLADTEVHSSVSCSACHSQERVSARLIDRVRWLASEFGIFRPRQAFIDPAACLDCHAQVLEETVTAGQLRMSHTEPVEAGLECLRCHVGLGHTETVVVLGSRMSLCIRCHDGELAAQDCSLCHVGDPADMKSGQRLFPTTVLDMDRDCGGCHSQTSCDECHGIRMPHSSDFIDGGHARVAAFDSGELLCRRCHTNGDCGTSCHRVPWEAHPDNWERGHAGAPMVSPCGCHALRSGRDGTEPFCPLCHSSNGSLLPPLAR